MAYLQLFSQLMLCCKVKKKKEILLNVLKEREMIILTTNPRQKWFSHKPLQRSCWVWFWPQRDQPKLLTFWTTTDPDLEQEGEHVPATVTLVKAAAMVQPSPASRLWRLQQWWDYSSATKAPTNTQEACSWSTKFASLLRLGLTCSCLLSICAGLHGSDA